MGEPTTIKVGVDITGMYYRRDVEVPEGSTILQAMQAARDADLADAAAGKPAPVLSFQTEPSPGGEDQIDGITVTHAERARSRQGGGRSYPAGRYEYFDDSVREGTDGSFEPEDPGKRYVLAWQYYVYDEEGVDRDRAGLNSTREVVASSRQTLNAPCLVVWRLVAIFMRPYGDSLKIAAARSRVGGPAAA